MTKENTMARFLTAKPAKIFKIGVLTVFAYLIVTMPIGCCARYYPSYSGRVLDEETLKPIEGAGVMLHFEISGISPGGEIHVGTRDAIETLTNTNGEFYFSPRLLFKFPNPMTYLDGTPEFFVIVPGYRELFLPVYPSTAKILINGKEYTDGRSLGPTSDMEIRLRKRRFTNDEILYNNVERIFPQKELEDRVPMVLKIAKEEREILHKKYVELENQRLRSRGK